MSKRLTGSVCVYIYISGAARPPGGAAPLTFFGENPALHMCTQTQELLIGFSINPPYLSLSSWRRIIWMAWGTRWICVWSERIWGRAREQGPTEAFCSPATMRTMKSSSPSARSVWEGVSVCVCTCLCLPAGNKRLLFSPLSLLVCLFLKGDSSSGQLG